MIRAALLGGSFFALFLDFFCTKSVWWFPKFGGLLDVEGGDIMAYPWQSNVYMNGYMPNYNQMQYGQQYQQTQQNQSGPDWIMAPSIGQVEQVSVQPGQKAWIMVQNEPVFALRSADNMGLVTTEYYKFEKFTPGTQATPGDYVTRKEFLEFVDSLKGEEK